MSIILDGTLGCTLPVPLVTSSGGSGGLVGGVEPIQPITASVGSSALTCTLNPTILNFRSTPLTSGTINTVSIASAISLTVNAGVQLATISAQQSRIVLIALYNGGTPVLGITSMVGGENLDETTLLTTNPVNQVSTFTGSIAVTTGILTLSAIGTGTFALGQSITGIGMPAGTYVKALLTGTLGAAASTYSTNTILAVASTAITGTAGIGVYSTAAVTASPFRVVGYIDNTQASSGIWATAPSTIQGMGGQALAAMSSLGYGQTWQNVTSSRATSTTYYNTTGKPIIVSVYGASSNGGAQITVSGIIVCAFSQVYVATALSGAIIVVPPNSSYLVSNFGGTLTPSMWAELR